MLEYFGFGFTQRFGAEKNMTDYSLVVLLLNKKKGTVRAKAVENDADAPARSDLSSPQISSAQITLSHLFNLCKTINKRIACFIHLLFTEVHFKTSTYLTFTEAKELNLYFHQVQNLDTFCHLWL